MVNARNRIDIDVFISMKHWNKRNIWLGTCLSRIYKWCLEEVHLKDLNLAAKTGIILY